MTAHEGRCDGSGQFRIELPRTTSARQYGLTVTAMAPGYGIGWTDLDPDADPPVADVALRPELIVRGRMFDVKGQPAPGVALRIELLIPVVRGTVSMPIVRPDFAELRRRDFPAWPGPAISDEQGRFTLRGLSRDLLCRLLVEDPRFALPLTMLQTAENVDARQPLALSRHDQGRSRTRSEADRDRLATGPDGRRARDLRRHRPARPPCPGRIGPVLFRGRRRGTVPRRRGPGGRSVASGFEPSPRRRTVPDGLKQGEWPKGAIEQSVDVALPRGVVVRGKITEEGTGRPVAGAVVRVTPHPAWRWSSAECRRPRGDGSGRHVPRRRAAGPGLPGRPGPRRRLRAPRVRRRRSHVRGRSRAGAGSTRTPIAPST